METKFRLLKRGCDRSKSNSASSPFKQGTGAFTLVELLTVIGIMGVLISILVPVLRASNRKAQIMTARNQISEIVEAVKTYQATYYGRYPVSEAAIYSKIDGQDIGVHDYTFGTIDGSGRTSLLDRLGNPLTLVTNTIEAPGRGLAPFDYQVNNSEIMSVLLDETSFHTPGGNPTVNARHQLNPKMQAFSRAPRTVSNNSAPPGVGKDLVYRDPWGNPYIITLDLDNNGVCTDAMYRMAHVTEQFAPANNSAEGRDDLLRVIPPPPKTFQVPPTIHPGDRHGFYINGPVAVWSFGPDGRANYNWDNAPTHKAEKGDNEDNILSWRLHASTK